MIAKIYISGKIGKDTTLVDVIRQFKSYEEPTEVLAIVDSIGGSKEEGDSIFNYLEGLKTELPVNTYAKKAYSISAKIFSVGTEREIDDKEQAAMIHNAWAKAEGNAEQFEIIAETLREYEKEFASFYSEILTVDETTAAALLENETFMSGKEAVEFGFATKLKTELKAVAEYNTNIKIEKMSDKKTKKTKGALLLEAMAAFVGVEINAELTLQDSNGGEIIFPDLESGDTPKVGDKATMDGAAIADGSYIMPSLEEATVVFVGGVITEIMPKEEEAEEVEEVEAEKTETKVEASEKETEIVAEEVQQISVWTIEVINKTFNEGDVVKYKDWDENEATVGAGEFQLSDGRRVVTDAAGAIVKIKEAAEAKEVPVEEGVVETETEASLIEKAKTEIKAEFEAKLVEKENEIKALNKQIGSKEFKAETKEIPVAKKDKGSRAANIMSAARNL